MTKLRSILKVSPEPVPRTSLTTDRLALRPFNQTDAPTIAQLAGRKEIADTTLLIPHPYSEQNAKDWIAAQAESYAQGSNIVFGIELNEATRLIGTIGLRNIDHDHSLAEMGFWIGFDFWGRGYATEAAEAVVHHAFRDLGLNRVYAHHMVRNPASGRVLEKIGMKREGLLRQCVKKWGVFEDVILLAVLREDWVK